MINKLNVTVTKCCSQKENQIYKKSEGQTYIKISQHVKLL